MNTVQFNNFGKKLIYEAVHNVHQYYQNYSLPDLTRSFVSDKLVSLSSSTPEFPFIVLETEKNCGPLDVE